MKEKRYFQYLAGENAGEIVVLDNVVEECGDIYYEFTNGEIMNRDFISPICYEKNGVRGKFMVEISDRSNAWTVEPIKEVVMDLGNGEYAKNAPPLEDYINAVGGAGAQTIEVESSIGKVRMNPPKRKTPTRALPEWEHEKEFDKAYEAHMTELEIGGDNHSETTEKPQAQAPTPPPTPKPQVVQEPQPTVVVDKPKIDETDPVAILVKSSKKTEYKIPVDISILLPDKNLYQIVDSQFEDGGKKFIDCVIKDLDITKVIESIGESLKASYSA